MTRMKRFKQSFSGADYICAFFCLKLFFLSSWTHLGCWQNRWQISNLAGFGSAWTDRTNRAASWLRLVPCSDGPKPPDEKLFTPADDWLGLGASGSLDLHVGGTEIRSEHVSPTDGTFGRSGVLIWLKNGTYPTAGQHSCIGGLLTCLWTRMSAIRP